MSQLDSSDKNISRKALDRLLEAEIHDFQLLVRVTNKLIERASSSDIDTRQHIESRCNIICNTNPGLALTLSILSESKDGAVLNSIYSNSGSIESNYPIKCLEIIQRWFRTNVLRSGVRLCGILQDIAKGDANKVDDFLCSWIADEKDYVILTFRLPDLLRDMFYWSDKKRLVDLLASTDLNDESQLGVVCTTLKGVLCDQRNDPRQFSQDFVDKAFHFVSDLAKSKSIDITTIESGEKNKLNRTLAIVDSVENLRRKVDFIVVQQNLKYCTNIRDLLGQQWFDKMITKKDTSHPLILLLDTKRSEGVALLKYIDRTVEILGKNDSSKLPGIRNRFKVPHEFFQTVGELVVYAHFRSLYDTTEMQYKVGERPVDCKVDIDKTKILIEVISFELPAPLKYGMIMADVPNRAKGRLIQDKLVHQIPPIAEAADNSPIFVVLNTTRGMDIDDMDIQDLLYGTLQLSCV